MRVLLALVGLLWLGALGRDAAERWIESTALPVLVPEVSSEIRDRDGQLLRAYTVEDGRWRMAVSLDAVDPRLVAMLIGYEDKRFRHHRGVDALALLRAAAQAARRGRIVSGGSTLTMQLARLLEDSGTGRWGGKLRQIRVALALERKLSKDAILALYLHHAPYGGNVEGVRAASLTWFGKEPLRLTAAEAALLVALPQAPEARRPDRHPGGARLARDRVLARLGRAGLLSEEEVRTAGAASVPETRRPIPALAPHAADRFRAVAAPRLDLTLDRDLQAALERLAQRFVAGRDPSLSVAIMVVDHARGEIRAAIGSPVYSEDRGRAGYVDMTNAVRSPGSTLKPLVYGLAFDRGLAHPETLIDDLPTRFGDYAPQNFDGLYRGTLRVSEALQLSLNVPTVKLTQALGPANLMAALRGAQARPVLPGGKAGLAVALGGVGMTMQDLVSVYTMLARGGTAIPLRWRRDAAPVAPVRVLSPAAAWQVGHVLAGIAPPPAGGPVGRVAYKTGTSYGHRDAWALGYDGEHVAAVWIGRPDGTPVPGVFGADLAAPLLFEVLGRVRGEPVALPPPPPETLIVTNAGLPLPLKRFDRGATAGTDREVTLAFPPDGAVLDRIGGALTVKLDRGVAPFTVLRDGAVALTGVRGREIAVPVTGNGFTTISVIDALGRSGRVSVELR